MILRCWLLALLALGIAGPALAHESLPLVISLSERAPDTFVVHVREPPALADRASATVHLPGTCVAAGQPSLMRCEGGIDGKPMFDALVEALAAYLLPAERGSAKENQAVLNGTLEVLARERPVIRSTMTFASGASCWISSAIDSMLWTRLCTK